jgi:hypothetical protein
MDNGRAWLSTWLILGGMLFGMLGCGGLGAGRTTNAAQGVRTDDPLRATQMLDASHKNYNSPIRR